MDDIDEKVLLARMDERTKNIEKSLKEFVRRDEFMPVKLIAFGLIGASTIALLSAVLATVIV